MISEAQIQTISIIPSEVHKAIKKINIPYPGRNYIKNIILGHQSKRISTQEKNQLLAQIIIDDLKSKSGKEYLSEIKFPNRCISCGGKGFNPIMELELQSDQCPGCHGTGFKTAKCKRCEGKTLQQILQMRDLIIKEGVEKYPELAKFAHYSKVNIDLPKTFIKENSQKTFRIFSSDSENTKEVRYFISRTPCKTCQGTGKFVYDKSKIQCPVCKGRKVVNRHMVQTGKIKAFIVCTKCHGEGKRLDNPVLNVHTLGKSGVLKLMEKNLLAPNKAKEILAEG